MSKAKLFCEGFRRVLERVRDEGLDADDSADRAVGERPEVEWSIGAYAAVAEIERAKLNEAGRVGIEAYRAGRDFGITRDAATRLALEVEMVVVP